MEYAVFSSGGKQHKVSAGDVISVDKLEAVTDGKVLFESVLLIVKDEKVSVGKPFVADAKIKASVVEAVKKGEKLDSYRFKAKSRSRKHVGFRPLLTVIKIEEILLGAKKASAK